MAKTEEEIWAEEDRKAQIEKRIQERLDRLASAGVSEKTREDFKGDPQSALGKFKASVQTALNPMFGLGDFAAALGTKLRTGSPLDEARAAARIAREEALLESPNLETVSKATGELGQFALPATGAGRVAAGVTSKIPYAKAVAGTLGSVTEGGLQGLIGGLVSGDSPVGSAALGAGAGGAVHGAGKAILPALGALSGSASMAKKLPGYLRDKPVLGTEEKPGSYYSDELQKALSGSRLEQIMDSPKGYILDSAEKSGTYYTPDEVGKIFEDAYSSFRSKSGQGATKSELDSINGMLGDYFDTLMRESVGGKISPTKLNAVKSALQSKMADKISPLEQQLKTSIASGLRKLEAQKIPQMADFNRSFLEAENAIGNLGINFRKSALPGQAIGDIDVGFRASPEHVDSLLTRFAKGKFTPEKEAEVKKSLETLGIEPEILDKAKSAIGLNFYRKGNISGSRGPQYGSQLAKALGLESTGFVAPALGAAVEFLSRPSTVGAAKLANFLEDRPEVANAIRANLSRVATEITGDPMMASDAERMLDDELRKRKQSVREK